VVQPPYGGIPPVNPYYGAMAPKPGCIPLRPLAVGEILGGAVEAIKRNPRTVLGLSAVAAVIQAVIAMFVQRYANQHPIDRAGLATGQADWGQVGSFLRSTIGLSLLSSVFAAVLTGMVVVVVTEDVVGRTASLELVWSKVRSRIWRLIVLSLAVAVLAALGLALFLAPGIWLWGIWAVSVPALIIENQTVAGAMGRSKNLVNGTFWRVWGIRALGFAMTIVASGAFTAMIDTLATAVTGDRASGFFGTGGTGSLSWSFLLISAIGTAIAITVTAPFLASLDSLLYVDLRMRKEYLARDLQQAAAAAQQPPLPGGNVGS
jgi:hypothetical protein